jgi:hypothetical protein
MGPVAPWDQALGLEAYARTRGVVPERAGLLAVLLPVELVRRVWARLTGVAVSARGVWHGVQARGRAAMARLDAELKRRAPGERPVPERLAAEIAVLPLRVGADGVQVPLRPHGGDPGGAARVARGAGGPPRSVPPSGARERCARRRAQAAAGGGRAG